MSVVLALRTESSIHIAADRLIVNNNDVTYGSKVKEFEACLVGTAGSRDLYCNFLYLEPPVYEPSKYVKGFTEFFNTTLREWARGEVTDSYDSHGVLAYLPSNEPPQLIELFAEQGKNWFSIELMPLEVNYVAMGSGRAYARGAFEALEQVPHTLTTHSVLDMCIRTACKCDAYCRPDPHGKIDIISRYL